MTSNNDEKEIDDEGQPDKITRSERETPPDGGDHDLVSGSVDHGYGDSEAEKKSDTDGTDEI